MPSRDAKRAAILKRLNRSVPVRRWMRELNLSARQLADHFLRVEGGLIELLGGPAQFAGKCRTYASGAIGFEVRCRGCQRCFWVTAIPYPLCADCDSNPRWR
jgi:hypothetical protein